MKKLSAALGIIVLLFVLALTCQDDEFKLKQKWFVPILCLKSFLESTQSGQTKNIRVYQLDPGPFGH